MNRRNSCLVALAALVVLGSCHFDPAVGGTGRGALSVSLEGTSAPKSILPGFSVSVATSEINVMRAGTDTVLFGAAGPTAAFTLDYGSYRIRVRGFDAQGLPIAEAVTEALVDRPEMAIALTMIPTGVDLATPGTGTLSLGITWPMPWRIASVSARLRPIGEPVDRAAIVLSAAAGLGVSSVDEGIPNGNWMLDVVLNASAGWAASLSEAVQISAGLSSVGTLVFNPVDRGVPEIAGRYVIKADGSLWCLGRPTARVGADSNWIVVASESRHSLAVRSDGSLWGWGANDAGQVGDGSTEPRQEPVRIGLERDWVAVAVGTDSLGLKSDGSLWGWGKAGDGQPGSLTISDSYQPVRLGEDRWRAISANAWSNLGIREDGSLWLWGPTWSHAAGTSPFERIGADVDWLGIAAGSPALAWKADGTLWQLGPGGTQTKVDSATDWMSAYSAGTHCTALKIDGSLWSWGTNDVGQLGLGTTEPALVPRQILPGTSWIAATGNLAIRDDGQVFGWGDNYAGFLGLPVYDAYMDPIRVGSDSDWSKVAVSPQSSCFGIRLDGSLWAWGRNDRYQLGLGDAKTRTAPVRVGEASDWAEIFPGSARAFAIKNDGSLWTWGTTVLGGGEVYIDMSPVQVGTDKDWVRAALAGQEDQNVFGLKADGSLWIWGSKGWYGVITGSPIHIASPLRVFQSMSWKDVYIGYQVEFLATDGTLWTLDPNIELAMIGTDSDWDSLPEGTWPGGLVNAATKRDGSLWAWNFSGLGPTPARISGGPWKSVSVSWADSMLVDSSGALWVLYQGQTRRIGSDSDWKSASASAESISSLAYHLMVKENGELWAWGSNDFGQLGIGLDYFTPRFNGIFVY